MILLMFWAENVHSQNKENKHCTINMSAKILESIENEFDNYEWHLNGQYFTPTDSTVRLKIHFPEIDTLIFKYNNSVVKMNDTIFTRFYPDSTYLIKQACCEEGFDIIQTKKFRINNYRKILFDGKYKSPILLSFENIDPKDSLMFIYGDTHLLTKYLKINEYQGETLFPHKDAHTSTYTEFLVTKWGEKCQTEYAYNEINSMRVISSQYLLFFNHEKVHITYNHKLKSFDITLN